MVKKLIIALMFAVPLAAQQPAKPTIAELKLQIATLKQQLIQAQAQILNYQFQQAKADEDEAKKTIAEDQAAKSKTKHEQQKK